MLGRYLHIFPKAQVILNKWKTPFLSHSFSCTRFSLGVFTFVATFFKIIFSDTHNTDAKLINHSFKNNLYKLGKNLLQPKMLAYLTPIPWQLAYLTTNLFIACLFDAYSLLKIGIYKPSSVVQSTLGFAIRALAAYLGLATSRAKYPFLQIFLIAMKVKISFKYTCIRSKSFSSCACLLLASVGSLPFSAVSFLFLKNQQS